MSLGRKRANEKIRDKKIREIKKKVKNVRVEGDDGKDRIVGRDRATGHRS